MRTYLILAVVSALSAVGFTAEHRLVNSRFLDVGNEWLYSLKLYELDGQSMNLSGTASISITGTASVSGYDVRIVETTSAWGHKTSYWRLLDDSLNQYGGETDDFYESLRSDNPAEVFPVWLDESYDLFHLGQGTFRNELKGSAYTWDRTYDTYITYLGHSEDLTVPAGTFACRVFVRKEVFTDSDGEHGYDETVVWVEPHIGIIKEDVHEWMQHWDGSESSARYFFELTSTNVSPQPFCAVRSMPMDLDGDCRVGLSDFAAFAEQWLSCALDPPDACWK